MKKIIFIFVGFAFSQTVHFEPEGNPDSPMTFYVTNAIVNGYHYLSENDEIGVFDGNRCVGAIALGTAQIIALADDGNGNGFTEGHSISFKFWLHDLEMEIYCDAISFSESGTKIENQTFEEFGEVDVSLDATEPLHYLNNLEFEPDLESWYRIYIEDVYVFGGEMLDGDEIGVFCPSDDGLELIFSGACVYRADLSTIWIKSFEDDPLFTAGQVGFVDGREMVFKIWFHNFNQELPANADFIIGDGTFGFQAEDDLIGSSTVNLSVESQTSVEPRLGNSENIDKLEVYPNPVFGDVTLSFEGLENGNREITVYDLAGRMIRSFDISGENGDIYWGLTDKFGRDVSAGIYFLKCKNLEEKILIIR